MKALNSSFRDPSGFVFSADGEIYRQVNQCFRPEFDEFLSSGLYEKLTGKSLLVSHQEVDCQRFPEDDQRYKIIKPQQIPYISYPYEWSFSQLKAAAMLTLKVQAHSLEFGFCLKDASAFNVQFLNGKPVFIDSLSFERYEEGRPWVAYKQFCQHFLAPLALITHTDSSLTKLSAQFIDGIPLTLTSKLLPRSTWLNYSLFAHIHVHAKAQAGYADSAAHSSKNTAKVASKAGAMQKKHLQALLESLAKTVRKLDWKLPTTEWGDYYQQTNYSTSATTEKHGLVDKFLSDIPTPIRVIQDLGANTGTFSHLAARHADLVVAQDIDPVAVEQNVRICQTNAIGKVLPLIQSLSEPSPAIGWANRERSSFVERGQCDVILCLALIHHLAISNNVPLPAVATLFSELTNWLIIEFVPKEDSQVQRLLATREDIFGSYNQEAFEAAFSMAFDIKEVADIPGTKRTLYLMRNRGNEARNSTGKQTSRA